MRDTLLMDEILHHILGPQQCSRNIFLGVDVNLGIA